MKTINNILLILAIVFCGMIAAVGILSVPETNEIMPFILLTIISKVIGLAALYATCRLAAYFNKINDIVIPRL